ncbi:RagB/SusD family nutrient uptake outer membrane protein [Mucilaginibacter daejeonensis]|uniref:RagB/SusD family nutrient uptake outer membrane protein n=1 Tax=Mucilaginibacter daejeonensis TaxID=398049 RepID=UPI001D17AA1A|nr:RagB/SusD family nutrient uptake outer membrane protein [Mucilaginibacter daejeonensis]UEG52276.1 RagB/SusD family nutrient uptake outer membrane protein [Mucilaginibacter daejeonensis]
MRKTPIKIYVLAALLSMSAVSCKKDLNLLPTNDITATTVYSTPAGYKQALAKVYGSYALTGNKGPAGDDGTKDIQGIDEGTSDFYRLYWQAQELPTDEAVIGWGDAGLPDFHNMSWSSNNGFLKGLYYRSFYQITLANDFIRQSTDGMISSRGISGNDATAIRAYRAEARFLRAYQYSVLMDLFGNVPFVTENDDLGASLPKQIARKDLFSYVESELKAIDGDLVAARQNEYGRADKAAAYALLARIYLNANVYTGTPRYNDAATYAKRVIDAGYSLIGNYRNLMTADNNLNTSEFILTINYDGVRTQGYGGTTFLLHASIGGSESAASRGADGGWAGLRTTKNLVNLFPDNTGAADKRAQFYTNGQSLEINNVSNFTDGYAITKYRNLKANGGAPSNLTFADIDVPLFRLSEMYLIYAESVLRNPSAGDLVTALGYVNLIRARAYGNATGAVTTINLDFILDERARELYWEAQRRTDLIRYDRFVTGAYLWPFKAGVIGGRASDANHNLYPLPVADVTSNTNLKQNPGY